MRFGDHSEGGGADADLTQGPVRARAELACRDAGMGTDRIRPAGRRLCPLHGAVRRPRGVFGTLRARCRAWTFSSPGTAGLGGSNLATCWLKNQVKPLVENRCCASGVKGAALLEMRPGPVENAIDRIGGDY